MQDFEETHKELLGRGGRFDVLEEAYSNGTEECEELGKGERKHDRPQPSHSLRVIDLCLVGALSVCEEKGESQQH